MDAFFLLQGAQAPNVALTLNRVALGVFFAISGYHKLFNPCKHAVLKRTLQDDGVHAVPIGSATFSMFPKPSTASGMTVVMLAGPGAWSLDANIAALLAK
jgi:uncharacterized membrane protein YphA (DoxX/SURF4 family)